MRCICVTHTLIDVLEVRLKEEEVVLGTILSVTVAHGQDIQDEVARRGLVDDICWQLVYIEETLRRSSYALVCRARGRNQHH
jgi:hypothetical protein